MHHTLAEAALVALLALGAAPRRLSRTVRSSSATLGLLSCSAILIHLYDGMIELHFHFFVTIAVVALYQAWRPYLLALGFVLLHHAVLGALAPGAVYNHQSAVHNPGLFVLVHTAFILAESIACLVYWKVTEDALDGERLARTQLHKAHSDLNQAQELSGVGSWEWDVLDHTVTWSDHQYVLAGVQPATFTPTPMSYLDLVHPDDTARVAALFRSAFDTATGLNCEFRLLRPDGSVRHVHALGEVETDHDGTITRFVGTSHDVTERHTLQAEIEHMAFHDPLTGLANRRLFLDRLSRALTASERSGRRCAVLFMDLDGFKSVNDTFGHPTGDVLLCEVARRLTDAARASDTVARFGGDEFAMLCEDVNATTAAEAAHRITELLHRPVELHGAVVEVRASTGIAVAEPGLCAEDILRAADAAMYAAKITGKHSHLIFPSVTSLT